MTMGITLNDDDQSPPATARRQTLSIQQTENNYDPTPTTSTDDYPSTTASSASSTSNSYDDPSTNDLTLLSGAILLTADCMGTGILALPADVYTLTLGTGGSSSWWWWGIGFLLLNLPINLYAGTILGRCAMYVEECIIMKGGHVSVKGEEECDDDYNGTQEREQNDNEINDNDNGEANDEMGKKTQNRRRKKGYSSVDENDSSLSMTTTTDQQLESSSNSPENQDIRSSNNGGQKMSKMENEWKEESDHYLGHDSAGHHRHADTATFDFVGMASMLFDEPIHPTMTEEAFASDTFNPSSSMAGEREHHEEPHDDHRQRRQITYKHPFTKVVLAVYYTNLFLVLGSYILVMSHAVSAMAGENNLCIPTAGVIASTLMFALSQLRTLANLGRSVSAVSLVALLIVVVQCLYSLHGLDGGEIEAGDDASVGTGAIAEEEELDQYSSYSMAELALAKMSSLASIGFAVGSQKLLLNIRHEMADRTKAAPGALSISLTIYGLAYIIVCILAGPHPPSFLFDAIPSGWGRRVAGFLLWVHVAVSYAINSQAFCSSIDRVVGHRMKLFGLEGRHRVRWGILTALVALSSYVVANAIPFFKDLVALCGAATSIPLTLLIPAIFYRRAQNVPLFFPTLHSKYSFLLLAFSIIFMAVGLIGAIGSIDVDWSNKSGPFACH